MIASTYSDMLDEAHATIDDLRSRLRVMAPMVCEGCGCAPVFTSYAYCSDCMESYVSGVCEPNEHAGACVSVGMRRLCGRRILEGC